MAAADEDANSNEDGDFASWAAYRKAKKKGEKKKVDDGGPKKVKDKVKGGVHILNDVTKNAGLRKKCNWCDSEYRLLARRP